MVEGDLSWLLGVKSLPGHMWFCSSLHLQVFSVTKMKQTKQHANRTPHKKTRPCLRPPWPLQMQSFHLYFIFFSLGDACFRVMIYTLDRTSVYDHGVLFRSRIASDTSAVSNPNLEDIPGKCSVGLMLGTTATLFHVILTTGLPPANWDASILDLSGYSTHQTSPQPPSSQHTPHITHTQTPPSNVVRVAKS